MARNVIQWKGHQPVIQNLITKDSKKSSGRILLFSSRISALFAITIIIFEASWRDSHSTLSDELCKGTSVSSQLSELFPPTASTTTTRECQNKHSSYYLYANAETERTENDKRINNRKLESSGSFLVRRNLLRSKGLPIFTSRRQI